MANAAEQVQELFGATRQRVRVGMGDEVQLHLDTGDVVEATIASLRSRSADGSKISSRSRTWSRWAGTTDDLLTFLERAIAEIERRSSEQPNVTIRLLLNGDDEERYFDVTTFEEEMRSADPGSPGGRLREINAIDMTVGPTQSGTLKANAVFSRAGIALTVEGVDRPVVSGLTDELARLIAAGRPTVPSLPGPAQMFVGGVAGVAYGYGLASVDWGFMPDGFLGDALFMLLYLVGFIALLYAVVAGMRLLLPALTLVAPGTTPRSAQWGRRILQVSGAVGLAVLPFALEQIFG